MKYKRLFTGKWKGSLTGMLMLAACSKNDVKPVDPYAKTGIAAVVSSNFSLSLLKYALATTNFDDTLSSPGPYTLLGPSNTAFQAVGLSSGAAIIRAGDSIKAMIPYNILRGQFRLDSLPLAFNQPLPALNGQTVYVTHWVNSRDTAVVVNGVRVTALDKSAANGLVNIISGILSPVTYANIQVAVSGDPALSLFNAAIIKSGLATEYQSGGPYTVFAPVNAAFFAIGITTTDSIYNMDPVVLKSMVKAHIAGGRNFIYDYILKADPNTNAYTEKMKDGTNASITLIRDFTQPGRFSGINIQEGAGNMASLSRTNILAGNGVVHSISGILTQ
ncbi:MAG: fasciclin domain-containing protein [Chitinophaga sp.]|uniref:fasciclin domain-containing protein n=1 Tax=Chitinophaga sp. TaxID=1869181 RepID=UPI001B0E286C|nr:fasciclin domain-containing protein [Chitinophaga sp.]MBO9731284.1 fasciclin domain-containing protein [Chitinophaga sp.]